MFTSSMNAANTDQSAMDYLIIEPTHCAFFGFSFLLLYFAFDPLIGSPLYAFSLRLSSPFPFDRVKGS